MCLGYYSFFVYKPFQDKHCIEFDLDENQGVRERLTVLQWHALYDHITF